MFCKQVLCQKCYFKFQIIKVQKNVLQISSLPEGCVWINFIRVSHGVLRGQRNHRPELGLFHRSAWGVLATFLQRPSDRRIAFFLRFFLVADGRAACCVGEHFPPVEGNAGAYNGCCCEQHGADTACDDWRVQKRWLRHRWCHLDFLHQTAQTIGLWRVK